MATDATKHLKLDMDALLPLRDVVYHTLRDAILKGELAPGERLMEIHLANRLGVSRTPIREAIRMLEQEGLAVTYPRKGAQVAKMSVKDLEDVIEIREALDLLAAAKACENIKEEDLEELRRAVRNFERSLTGNDVRKIVEADEAFHNIIYRVANNPKLQNIVMNLREQMYRYRYEYVKDHSALNNLLEEHAAILKGLQERDKEYVKKFMQLHLDNQYMAVKSMIKKQEEALS